MKPVEAAQETFYSWGGVCSGWRLLELDHFQVRQELMPPGTAEEPHMHSQAHQFFYILDGQMTVRTPAGTVQVAPGQGLHVPPGQPHWVRNEGLSDLIFLLSSSPGTADDRQSVQVEAWAGA